MAEAAIDTTATGRLASDAPAASEQATSVSVPDRRPGDALSAGAVTRVEAGHYGTSADKVSLFCDGIQTYFRCLKKASL